jgi:pimeloyl-ACP methyl ester carboxylesterase
LLPPTGGDRDALVASIQDDLGGAPRGLLGDVLKRVSGLFTPIATPLLRWTRDSWSVGVSPAIGDILMYQSRGKDIRDYIKTEIEAQQGPVVLLAHSLGGIAAVDLLLTTDIPQVRALVTVGSQSPYLYGINALTGLEKGRPWPDCFPRNWLNVYDTNDFLSYPGAGILPGRVKDFRHDGRQPFPESHSAYWRSPEVWKEIDDFLKEVLLTE